MAQKSSPLAEATKEQMRAFGRDTAGISFPGFAKEAHMRAKLSEAGYDSIKVADEPEKPKAAAPKPAPKPKPKDDEENDGPAPPEPPLTAAEIVAGNAAKDEDPAVVRARIARDGEYVRVIIARSPGEGGDEPVLVSYNGRAMRIARGEPQMIRRPFYECLVNSEERHFDMKEENGIIELTTRMVSAYPFSRVG